MQSEKKLSNYENVTETPETKGSQEQVARLYSRYRFVADLSKDKDVIEVGCGAGLGLGYLARFAKKVVGGDVDEKNLHFAKKTYSNRNNIKIIQLDAHKLPFKEQSFDVVILFEAIYYLMHPELFIREAYRILRSEGILIICSVNKDWDEFNPSPFSYKYYAAPELYSLLESNMFQAKLFGQCLVRDDTFKSKIVGAMKKGAIKCNVMPKTMKGKELLKRIFFGKLISLPPEISEGLAEYIAPVPIPHDKPNFDYKVLFSVAQKISMAYLFMFTLLYLVRFEYI